MLASQELVSAAYSETSPTCPPLQSPRSPSFTTWSGRCCNSAISSLHGTYMPMRKSIAPKPRLRNLAPYTRVHGLAISTNSPLSLYPLEDSGTAPVPCAGPSSLLCYFLLVSRSLLPHARLPVPHPHQTGTLR